MQERWPAVGGIEWQSWRNIAMAAVQTAMMGRMPYTMLRDAIFTHPTMSEGLIALLASIPAKSTQRSA